MKDSIDILHQEIKQQKKGKKKLNNQLECIKPKNQHIHPTQIDTLSHLKTSLHQQLPKYNANIIHEQMIKKQKTQPNNKMKEEYHSKNKSLQQKIKQDNDIQQNIKSNQCSKISSTLLSIDRQDIQHLNQTSFFGNQTNISKTNQISQHNKNYLQNKNYKQQSILNQQNIKQKSQDNQQYIKQQQQSIINQQNIKQKQQDNQFIQDNNHQQLKISINQIKSQDILRQQIVSFRKIKNDSINIDKQPQQQKQKLLPYQQIIIQKKQQNNQPTNQYGLSHLTLNKILQLVSKSATQATQELLLNINKINQTQLQFIDKQNQQNIKQLKQHNHNQVQTPLNTFISKLQTMLKIFQKRTQQAIFISLKPSQQQIKQQQQVINDKKHERINSAIAISQDISSAQSQRLKQQISLKSSQNVDQSFHLDLTVKSKNSGNPYKIYKMDSLIYSVQNGFGYYTSTPDRTQEKRQGEQGNSNSNKSVLQKMDDAGLQGEQQVSGSPQKSDQRIHKSLSHNSDHRPFLMIYNQQLQQYHQNQPDYQQKYNSNQQYNKYHQNNEDYNQPSSYIQLKDEDDKQNYEKIQNIDNFQKVSQFCQINQQVIKNNVNDNNNNTKNNKNDNIQLQNNKNMNKKQQIPHKYQTRQKSYRQQLSQQPQSHKITKKQKQQNIIKSHNHKSYQKILNNHYINGDKINSQKNHSKKLNQSISNHIDNFDADDQQGQSYQQEYQNHQSEKKQGEEIRVKNKQSSENQRKKQIAMQSKNSGPSFHHIYIDQLHHGQNKSLSVLQNKSNKLHHVLPNSNVFHTEISNYQNKINRMKEQKQLKKRKLQQQLAKINHEIKILNKKQQQLNNSSSNPKNILSRIKISQDNSTQFQKKGHSLVKNIISQKGKRNIIKINEYKNKQKNINQYIQQLTNLRIKNQDRIKQKKKIQILQRMKQKQFNKVNQKKKIQANQKFVIQLKSHNGSCCLVGPTAAGAGGAHQQLSKRTEEQVIEVADQNRILHEQFKQLTPNLNNKKVNLKLVRGLSVKKHQLDIYEKVLS